MGIFKKFKNKIKSTVKKVIDTVKKNPLKVLAAIAAGPITGVAGIGKSAALNSLLKGGLKGTIAGKVLDKVTAKDARQEALLTKLMQAKEDEKAKILATLMKQEQLKKKESVTVDEFSKNRFDRQFSYEVPYDEPDKATTDTEDEEVIIPVPIPTPKPTPDELALYRKYTNKGIYWKSNNNFVNGRDLNGNVILDLGDDIVRPVIINDQLQPIVKTIPAPTSGHLKIPINVNVDMNIKERNKYNSLKRKDKERQRLARLVPKDGIGY